MSALLGVAFLISLALLWRQGKGKRRLRKEVQVWEGKYWELFDTRTSAPPGGAEPQPMHQLVGWGPSEIGGQSSLSHQLEGRNIGEIDGVQVDKVAGKTGQVRCG